ncbi:MAG: hypothetical protein ACOCXJ_07680, partial [Planctomycetota bacterium]
MPRTDDINGRCHLIEQPGQATTDQQTGHGREVRTMTQTIHLVGAGRIALAHAAAAGRLPGPV